MVLQLQGRPLAASNIVNARVAVSCPARLGWRDEPRRDLAQVLG